MKYDQSSRYFQSDTTLDLVQTQLSKFNYLYDTTLVKAEEENRLDLVSYRVYGTPVNWWIIARFNAIIEPNNVPVGTELRIPRLG